MAVDLDFATRLLSGDEAAFTELVRAHHGALVRLARVFVGSGAAAEEVAQETWLAVLQGISAFEGRSSLKTWIFRILTNKAKTRGVRDRRALPFSALGHEASGAGADDAGPFDARGHWTSAPDYWDGQLPERVAERRELLGLVQEALDTLPDNQRAVVTLRDVQGWAPEEVCDLLEISEANQRVLLHRGRSRIRAALAKHLGVGHAKGDGSP